MIKELTVYQCDLCKNNFMTQRMAETHHCSHNRHCEDCGELLTPTWHYTVCNNCYQQREVMREAKRFEKARKLTVAEYEREFPGYMYCDGDDQYDSEADSLADYIMDTTGEYPKYVWGTEAHAVELDAGQIVDMLNDHANAPEDYRADDEACAEIEKFVERFNERHGTYSFYVNYGVAVLLPERESKGEV